jgi:hypothetical protein
VSATKAHGYVLLCVLASSSSMLLGCEYFPEATFNVASSSRLPKWITLPPNMSREDVRLTMSYYALPWGNDVLYELLGPKKEVIERVHGKEVCQELLGPANKYPSYVAVNVNGITEVMEHAKMEPVFYVTDDRAILKQYSANGC